MADIETLKARRKALKMTFEDLASASNIPIRTLENIFHGITRNPRTDTMQAIEKALGIVQEDTPTYTEEERKLFGLIEQLTDAEVEELSNFVDFIISKRK